MEVFPIVMAKNHHGPGTKPVIFVVDDEPMLLDLAELLLQPAGFEVRTFQDPSLALADYKAAKPPPPLVITDYAMGSMNGLDLMHECRKLHPDQKIILVSGTVDESVYAGTDIKPDHFLAKPYDPDEFVALARTMTGG